MSVKEATYYVRDHFQTKVIVKAPGIWMWKEEAEVWQTKFTEELFLQNGQ